MTGTLGREVISTRQRKIAELAQREPKLTLTTLAHHVDDVWMRDAYRRIRKDAAAGVDGVTAAQYEAELEANLSGLLERFKSGGYRAHGKFVLILGRQSGLLKQESRVLSAPFWTLVGGLMAMVRCDGDLLERDRRLRRDPGMTGRPLGFGGLAAKRRSRPEGALSQALCAGWCSRSSSGSRGRGVVSWPDCAWSRRRRARAP